MIIMSMNKVEEKPAMTDDCSWSNQGGRSIASAGSALVTSGALRVNRAGHTRDMSRLGNKEKTC